MTPPELTQLERPSVNEAPTTLAMRVALRYLDPPIMTAAQASGRITAFVYGHLVVLGALLALLPTTAVSGQGALTIVGAGLSTFIAHAFADMLGRRIGHGHRSVLGALLGAARYSLPIVTAMIAPIGVLAVGGRRGRRRNRAATPKRVHRRGLEDWTDDNTLRVHRRYWWLRPVQPVRPRGIRPPSHRDPVWHRRGHHR